MMIKLALAGLLAYLIGSLIFGVVLPKVMGESGDVRKEGSGNVGATNVLRTQGKLKGALVLAGDMAKGFLAAWIGLWLAGPEGGAVAGICAMIGHCFPLYFGFKGGKAVATGAGIVLALVPKAMLFMVPVFILVVVTIRIVSLGSLAGCFTLIVCIAVWRSPLPVVAFSLVAVSMITWRHRENISRIIAGTENRFGGKKE